jgi:hypothetical protein
VDEIFCGGVAMGVDTELYTARIGTFYGTCIRMKLRGSEKVGGTSWSIGLVISVLLVVGVVEVNSGLQTELEKSDQILTNVKNQEKETKSINGLLEAHDNEIGSIKVGRKEIGAKLERLSAAIEGLIAEYKHIDQ